MLLIIIVFCGFLCFQLVSHPFFKGGDISGLQKYNPGPVSINSRISHVLAVLWLINVFKLLTMFLLVIRQVRFGSNVKQLLRLYRDRKDDIIR